MYFPQLDSIRGISVVAIFLFHTVRINYTGFLFQNFVRYLFNNLLLGIDAFFILSSFLLTYLAINEYKKKGNYSLENYFKRRILRIWPLYFFILILGFIIFPVLANWFHIKITLPPALYYILFVANFYTIDHVFFLRVLWSISVEEQFYLFWGVCLRFYYKNLYTIIFSLFTISIAFSLVAILNKWSYYFNTLTYLFDFGSGALAAVLIFKNAKIIQLVCNLSRLKTYLFYSYLPFHFVVFYILDKNFEGVSNEIIGLLNRYIFIIYISLFIDEQMMNISRTKVFEKSKVLIYTGKISYGLYCFHGITILMVNLMIAHFKIEMWNGLAVIIYFFINYSIASLSYFYLEYPFLKLKDKWRRI